MIPRHAVLVASVLFVGGCRLGERTMVMPEARSAGGAPATSGPDERPPSVRDPGLATELPPRAAGHPYRDPNEPAAAPVEPGPDGGTHEMHMHDMHDGANAPPTTPTPDAPEQ